MLVRGGPGEEHASRKDVVPRGLGKAVPGHRELPDGFADGKGQRVDCADSVLRGTQ